MTVLTRRSVLRSSLAFGAAGALVRPHIANAAATTAEMWWAQGFAKEEDVAFKKMVADYEKESGNKIEYSLIPFAPMRQKAVAALQSGVVPDIMENADLEIASMSSWEDKLVDVSDIVETLKKDYAPVAIESSFYAYGYQLTANGVDPIATYNAFLIAYGGKALVTPDGRLNTGDPQVRAAAAKAIEKLTTPFKKGYVPPGVVNWNDADDNNAFHAKLMVMDFDGTISTEVAIYDKKEDYDAIETRGLPLGNDGKPLTAQVITDGAMIPKGAKNVAAAKEFLKYAAQPKVLNEWLKGGLGRFMLPIPELVQSDPFWLKEDPHRKAYGELTVLGPQMPIYEVYNPAIAEVNGEHLFSVAMFDAMNNGMTPEQAIDKAFKRAEEIFAKYPIQQA